MLGYLDPLRVNRPKSERWTPITDASEPPPQRCWQDTSDRRDTLPNRKYLYTTRATERMDTPDDAVGSRTERDIKMDSPRLDASLMRQSAQPAPRTANAAELQPRPRRLFASPAKRPSAILRLSPQRLLSLRHTSRYRQLQLSQQESRSAPRHASATVPNLDGLHNELILYHAAAVASGL